MHASGNLPKALSSTFTPPDLDTKKISFSDRLHPPGLIYYVYGEPGGKYDRIEETAPSLFHDLILSGTMFLDHFPDLYEDSLKLCLDRVRARGPAVQSTLQEDPQSVKQ